VPPAVVALGVAALSGGGAPHPAAAAAGAVSIDDGPLGCSGGASFCFSPASLTVRAGDAVTWTSNSGAPHRVTRCTAQACSGDGAGTGADAGPASMDLGKGQSYTLTFSKPGTYNYYCSIHGYNTMHGTVTVG